VRPGTGLRPRFSAPDGTPPRPGARRRRLLPGWRRGGIRKPGSPGTAPRPAGARRPLNENGTSCRIPALIFGQRRKERAFASHGQRLPIPIPSQLRQQPGPARRPEPLPAAPRARRSRRRGGPERHKRWIITVRYPRPGARHAICGPSRVAVNRRRHRLEPGRCRPSPAYHAGHGPELPELNLPITRAHPTVGRRHSKPAARRPGLRPRKQSTSRAGWLPWGSHAGAALPL
jgi:hypothetical protein